MRRLAPILTLTLALLGAATAARAGGIERLHQFMTLTQAATADFEQRIYGREGKVVQESRGTFAFSRPGRFRWSYARPYAQLIVGDGVRVWIYDEELRQVTVRKLDLALGATPAALLSGNQDVEQAFTWKDLGASNGLDWLSATPVGKESTFQEIRLGFDANTLAALELFDAFGQRSVVKFSGFERNPKLAATLFQFTPPKGADVLGEK